MSKAVFIRQDLDLLQSIPVVRDVSLIKVLAIREKDLEQLQAVKDFEEGDQLVGRTGWCAIIHRGVNYFMVRVGDFKTYVADRDSHPGEIDKDATVKQVIDWHNASQDQAHILWQNLPQIFIR